MQAASRFFFVLFGASILFLFLGCQEESAKNQMWTMTRVISSSDLKTDEPIDWEEELSDLMSQEVLKSAATELGMPADDLKASIRLSLASSKDTLEISGIHEDQDQADSYSLAMITAFHSLRAGKVDKVEISPDEILPTLEQDRMTFDKALKALEEDPE